jgi:hypothetical protein
MKEQEQRPRLRLVQKPIRTPVNQDDFVEPGAQALLFPLPKKDLLLFLLFPGVTEEEFTAALDYARPVIVLELRRSPRFDIGGLNRRAVFEWFERSRSKYYDLPSQLSVVNDDSRWNPLALVEAFLSRVGPKVEGPVMLLINDDRESQNLATLVAQRFASASKSAWHTFEIPQYA